MNTATLNHPDSANAPYNMDNKQEIEMLENEKPSVHFNEHASADVGGDMRGQELTGYEDLTLFQTLKTFKKTSLLCFAVTFTACAEGYEIGMTNNINANQGLNRSIGDTIVDGHKSISAAQFAKWSPLSTTGQVLGQVGFPFISSRFGRKWSLILIWLTATVAITLQSVTTDNDRPWAAAKIFTGLSVGAIQTVVPVYVCELAPTKIRGSLISLYNFWFQLGNFFPPIVFQVLQNKNRQNEWKLPVYTQWATIAIIGAIFFFAPESPVWCAQKDHRERGIAILQKLNGGIEGYSAEKQYEILRRGAEYEKAKNAEIRKEHWWNIFLGTNLIRLVISTWTILAFQLLGLGLFLSYGSIFYAAAGVEDPFLVVIINNCVTLGSILPIILFADKLGRRMVCLVGMDLMWIACLLVGVLGVVKQSSAVNSLLVFFSCIWTLGLQTAATAAYGYLAETSTQSLREYTSGWAYAVSTIFGTIWGIMIPYMLDETEWNWNLKTGFFFFGIGAFSAVGGWFVLPETAKRTPAELDELFARKIKPWRFHKTKTATQLAADESKQQHDASNI